MPQSRFLAPLLLLAVLLVGAGHSLAQAPQSSNPAIEDPAKAKYRDGLEHQAFSLINDYRKANKLPLLQWDTSIAKVARDHSRDMALGDVGFGHAGFGQRVTLLKTQMTGLKGAGENVFKCDFLDQVAEAAVSTWLNSPHHLENIRGDYNYSGMGVWQNDDGMIYFTQIFVKINPQTASAQAAPALAPGVATPLGLLADPRTR